MAMEEPMLPTPKITIFLLSNISWHCIPSKSLIRSSKKLICLSNFMFSNNFFLFNFSYYFIFY